MQKYRNEHCGLKIGSITRLVTHYQSAAINWHDISVTVVDNERICYGMLSPKHLGRKFWEFEHYVDAILIFVFLFILKL